jgi:RND superfamily putative drug exporter
MHLAMAGRLTGPVTKWVVVVLWLLVVAGSYPFASRLVEVQNNEATSWLPAEAESVQALERLRSFQDVDDIPTTVVYHRDGGLTAADYATMAAQAEELADLRGVVTPPDGRPPVVVPPDPVTGQQLGLVSADGEVATVLLTFNLGAQGWNDLPAVTDELREVTVLEGGQVHLAGAGGEAADAAAAFGGIDGKLLLAALGVVIVILLFTYRSPVLWILPILSAVVALFTAQGIVYFLAKYADLTVNGQSQAILSVLVIGAGTDYALLLVARYREELRRHEDRHEAMAFALHRAAPAIVASAATVAVGMLCLLLAEMSSTAGLGPVAAIGVAVTLVVMLTLLPALLVVCGRWVFWPYRPGFGSHEPTTTGRWARLGAWIARRPRPVWVGTSLALGVACLGLVTMNVGTVPADEQYTQEFDSVTGQRLLVAHGLADTSSPVHVVASADHAEQVVTAIGTVDGLGTVQTAIPPVDGVKLISITQEADPASPEAVAEVEAVRGAVQAVPGADAQVTGTAALFLDSERASIRDSLLIIPLVLLVVMLILMVLLRAVLAPVLLILTVVLSFGAALGISTLVFHGLAQVLDEGAGFELVGSAFPLFTFVFLVALGIDYNIFLMTRVREETATRGTREGSLVALASTGGVITSAGLVLAATFAVLGTLPLVFLAQMGITVALGVMLDTMVVRSVLVTAINLDLGGRIWWPGRLDRAQPAAEVMPGRHVGTGTA